MFDSSDSSSFSELQAAMLRRSFRKFCCAALAPLNLKPAAHHLLIIDALQDLADDVGPDFLMIEAPPGSAKSTYVSKLFPPWQMSRRKNTLMIGASSTSGLAIDFSRNIQQIIADMGQVLGFSLRREAVDGWNTTNGCEYIAVGVTGSAQGRRADRFLIDDPLKGRKEADSPIEREIVWQFFNSVVMPRLRPGGKVAIVSTRWHGDDLCGRLLATDGDLWRRVRIRAQAIAGEVDPLARAPGEFLWGDDSYGYADVLRAAKARYERACATREWHALYQQEPKPPEGSLFDVSKIGFVDHLGAPPGSAPPGPFPVYVGRAKPRRSVRAWDLAATEAEEGRDPDWTVGFKLTEIDNRFVIEDVTRFRANFSEVVDRMRSVAEADGRDVAIAYPQDPGQAGKSQAQFIAARLAGFTVRAIRPTGTKATRATPFASQVGAGTVDMVRAPWNAALMEELRDFPHGDHDDQVDAGSDAFNSLTEVNRGGGRVQSIY